MRNWLSWRIRWLRLALCHLFHNFASHSQICKRCGRCDGFDFHVPDDLWAAVREASGGRNVLCLGCFVEIANTAESVRCFLPDGRWYRLVQTTRVVG